VELLVVAAIAAVLWRVLRRRTPTRRPPGAVAAIGWCDGTNWRVLPPLARAETRAVLRHPAFIAGAALTPLMLLAATNDSATGSSAGWRDISTEIALALVPLAWLTIVAVNLVALRSRRSGADELVASLPAPQPVRATALLATVVGPVTVGAALAAGWVALTATRDDVRGAPAWPEITVGILILAGAVMVGVAVARWLPSAVFGVVAAVSSAIIQGRFLDVTTWPWNRAEGDPLRFLAFIADLPGVDDAALELRPAGWHLLYLIGLVLVMAGVALARDGLRRPVAGVLAVAALLVGGAGWMQTRPPSGTQQAQMVAYLTDPAAHQTCETSAGVNYCAYPGFTSAIAGWRDRVETTLGVLPPGAAVGRRRPLEVTQRPAIIVGNEGCSPTPFEASLPPPVAARVSPAALWPADDNVHPGFAEESFPCSDREVHGFFLAVQVGAWAVGLPPAPHDRDQRCTANGQTRAVVALWAAAAGTPDGARTLQRVLAEGAPGDGTLITFGGGDWNAPPMWGVDYAANDAALALALLDRPANEVRDTLAGDWARWTDPATSSADLARALDVDTPIDATDAAAVSPCR
jgi:hypothetical protein